VSLIAYFDESGTHSGGPNAAKVFSLVGYIATQSLWKDDFVPKWNAMLNRFELPDPKYFHATELEGGSYPYNRLNERQREDLKMSAVNIPVNSGMIGVGGAVLIPAYKRMLAPYIKAGKIDKDPYVFLFSQAVVESIAMSSAFLGEDPRDPIAFVFDNHPRWSLQAHEMYVRMQNDKEWPNRVWLGTVRFEDKKKYVPLQAADNIAFETYHYVHGNLGRPAMNRFLSWPQNHARYYNEEGLQAFIDICRTDGKF